jgi:molecular chaperone GrpE
MQPNEPMPGHEPLSPAADEFLPENAATEAELSDAEGRLAQAEQELAAVKEQWLRERAEMENQRKRLAREVEQARRFANERVLSDLLPVIDSLQAGLGVADAGAQQLREGLELTLKQLLKAGADHGLEMVDPTGQAFDPERHQAVSVVEAPGAAPGSVVQVFQKGWALHGRLLRPAMVVVAKAD